MRVVVIGTGMRMRMTMRRAIGVLMLVRMFLVLVVVLGIGMIVRMRMLRAVGVGMGVGVFIFHDARFITRRKTPSWQDAKRSCAEVLDSIMLELRPEPWKRRMHPCAEHYGTIALVRHRVR